PNCACATGSANDVVRRSVTNPRAAKATSTPMVASSSAGVSVSVRAVSPLIGAPSANHWKDVVATAAAAPVTSALSTSSTTALPVMLTCGVWLKLVGATTAVLVDAAEMS